MGSYAYQYPFYSFPSQHAKIKNQVFFTQKLITLRLKITQYLMKKFKQTLSCILLSTCSFSIFAQPATSKSVERAMELSDIKATLAQSQQEMRPVYDKQAEEMLKNIFKTLTLNAEQKKAANQIADVTASFSNKLISDPKFLQMLKNTYMQTFTEEEVLANIQFLETPIGQSINKKNSLLMSKIMQNSIEMSSQMMQDPKVQKEVNQKIENILMPLFEQESKTKQGQPALELK
ncbi:DUF2059 domain-containing protein [Acinetobacter sp. C32I]|uniref:DUF2059 domain-containing protein n=1 Tax=Acinetobacter sp. C32I TaxID=2950074 RepID=UPI002036E95C|nr:DUF2059 domain-containing protein [Acinetobacter sp. C32I]USA52173.1 DUF2059 domain-containing protein [Acinetobacter sp. C32I]